MIVKELKVRNIRIPLNVPKSYAGTTVRYRDYTVVNIITQSGVEGWAFVWGTPAVRLVIEEVRHMVVGQSALEVKKIWNKIFFAINKWGRGGVGMRALAGIDIALWDIVGKAANMPIYRMLGACRDQAPAYYTGGYLPDGVSKPNELLDYHEKEVSRVVERGFKGYKMKIGAGTPAFDLERVALARKVLGPDRDLMVDCNCGYDPETVIQMGKRFEELNVAFVEEPVPVDDLPNCAYVASRLSMPVAMGENHYTRWDIRNIIDYKAARIYQAEPTVAGGVTEYLNMAGACATYGVKMAPHCFHDFNIQMALCIPEIITLEFMDANDDIINVQKIFQNPVPAQGGVVRPPEGPGHGLLLDEKAMERYAY